MESLFKLMREDEEHKKLAAHLNTKETTRSQIKGLSGSAKSIYPASYIKELNQIHLFITAEKEDSAYLLNDLENSLIKRKVCFFPSFAKHSARYGATEKSNIILRTEVLNLISNYDHKNPLCIVTYAEAILGKVVSKNNLKENTLIMNVGEELSMEFIEDVLVEYNFEKVDFVYEPGQFAVRGGLIDMFSFSNTQPYRIDFFGDEIESIREFDVETQLSLNKVEQIEIVPNLQLIDKKTATENIFESLPEGSIIWGFDFDHILQKSESCYEKLSAAQTDDNVSENILATSQEIKKAIINHNTVEISNKNYLNADLIIEQNTSPQPKFNKNFEILANVFEENQSKDYTNIVLSSSSKQMERLAAIFADIRKDVKFDHNSTILHEGFIDHNLKIGVFTDHQIFERYHKAQIQGNFEKKDVISIKELNKLQPGDYIVHIDHGVGQFGGLVRSVTNGKPQEVIRILYRDSDILDVNIHNLHRISKFKSKDGTPPKLNKLGSGVWNKLKQTTKKKVNDIAKELISLYAQRREQRGFAFAPDNYLQQELEASFIYEDTPDQEKATLAVKRSMEREMPMDMLVCGDVGFGKTEVAMRAAFKAVNDNKQVAVLVPTTILALQHYHSFSKRLKDFPVSVNYISRMKKPKEQKEIMESLKNGSLDIIIGTHKLASKDIIFKDLGLLIIDEEQRFGVAMKEKLKKIKTNVDTLTLTATPIPRTLQFSLMGARDMAIINTPPPNRHPILTELHTFNDDIIKETISKEVGRNGQVFFINNRVQNIEEIQAHVNRLLPGIRTVVAHGQMEGKQLEQIMLDFINHEFDVLIATTIIESGLDIPNANTIIINNAHQFGLSELHQLRGRVGRSNKKAYCYLLAPPITTLTNDARRKLTAIESYSDLGSGLNISMQDLDIRGAGNLLGGEQSGFIADIGFETYHKILNEAIQELKDGEFKEVFEDHENKDLHKTKFITDCQIDTDMEVLFPDSYISNTAERLMLYRELDNITDEQSLTVFEKNLIDRFGNPPQQTKDLIDIVRLRWIAVELGFEKIILKNEKMILHFISNPESEYYNSPKFPEVINYVQTHPANFKMREKNNKLALVSENIKNVQTALTKVENINNKA